MIQRYQRNMLKREWFEHMAAELPSTLLTSVVAKKNGVIYSAVLLYNQSTVVVDPSDDELINSAGVVPSRMILTIPSSF